jgi:ribokinase
MGRVLVLGNAGLDLGLRLPRLPRPGETLPGRDATRTPGAKGLNQAVAAARAGATVLFAAPLGQDPQGEEIAAWLAGEGLAGLHLPRLPHPTDFSVLLLPGGENSITGAGPLRRRPFPRRPPPLWRLGLRGGRAPC